MISSKRENAGTDKTSVQNVYENNIDRLNFDETKQKRW